MTVPGDCKYTAEHEWVRVDGEEVVCGITEFAQSELGEIVFVELPAEGTAVSKGDSLCVVESTKAASDVYAPIGGTVADVNAALQDGPDLVNADPYKDGWMVRLKDVSTSDLEALMDAAAYQALLDS
jgi:glycine cleavage system H protein